MQVKEVNRLAMLRSVIGKSEAEARRIVGPGYAHEFNAIFLRLHSSSEAFNRGVRARLNNDEKNPYSPAIEKASYIYFDTGWHSCDLAIALHSREAVMATL